jgi:4-hydroxy 2-oxovalerate aldolase
MNKIIISDPSLRDGNHSVKHQISLQSIERYCKFADEAKIPIVEVGHGNGLGASSLLIGKSLHSDFDVLNIARKNLKCSKLSVHSIPGISTLDNNIKPAIDCGVDIFRIATHCTEATLSKTHIEFLKKISKEVHGVLMMSALITSEELTYQAKVMESYGAEAIIIMDSTGTYMPSDIKERINSLVDNLSIPVGFHGHNNLGLSVANSLIAAECGAAIIDACICGFGAGAGNTPLELIIPVLEKNNYETEIDFNKVIKEAENVLDYLVPQIPVANPVNILTGLNKLFSGFEKPIIKASKLYNIEYSSLIFELGNRKLVAGQEDLILEIAQNLNKNKNKPKF